MSAEANSNQCYSFAESGTWDMHIDSSAHTRTTQRGTGALARRTALHAARMEEEANQQYATMHRAP